MSKVSSIPSSISSVTVTTVIEHFSAWKRFFYSSTSSKLILLRKCSPNVFTSSSSTSESTTSLLFIFLSSLGLILFFVSYLLLSPSFIFLCDLLLNSCSFCVFSYSLSSIHYLFTFIFLFTFTFLINIYFSYWNFDRFIGYHLLPAYVTQGGKHVCQIQCSHADLRVL